MKLFEKIEDIYYNILHGIQNIIKWFPIIWKDRNFDEYYLLQILYKKFESMEDLHRNHGHLVRSKETANQLKKAMELCRRMIDNPYWEETGYDERWEYEPLQHIPEYGSDGKIKWYKVVFPEKSNEEELDWNNCIELEKEKYKNDKTELFNIMKNHIDEWWD